MRASIDDRSLHVAQLAHVVVVTVGPGRPAEEHVARRLHEPLPGDDPLALVPVGGHTGVGREDRRLCFLDLQEQRRAVVVVHQQRHVTAGPDAADAHDLPGRVHHLVPIQQHPAFGTHRFETRLDDLPGYVELVLCVEDERRVLDDPASPVDQLGQLRERGEAGVLPGVRDHPLDRGQRTRSYASGRARAPRRRRCARTRRRAVTSPRVDPCAAGRPRPCPAPPAPECRERASRSAPRPRCWPRVASHPIPMGRATSRRSR